MSKNRGDYVAAQERFVTNTNVRTSCDDVTALAHPSEIDPAREDASVKFEPEVINEKSTTA